MIPTYRVMKALLHAATYGWLFKNYVVVFEGNILVPSCHYIHEGVKDLKGITLKVTSPSKLLSLLLLDSLLSFGYC